METSLPTTDSSDTGGHSGLSYREQLAIGVGFGVFTVIGVLLALAIVIYNWFPKQQRAAFRLFCRKPCENCNSSDPEKTQTETKRETTADTERKTLVRESEPQMESTNQKMPSTTQTLMNQELPQDLQDGDPQNMDTNGNTGGRLGQMAGISEKLLAEIGEEGLGNHPNVPKLGRELGFKEAQISMYMQTNHVGGQVGSKGTVNLLIDWKRKTPPAQQVPKLRAALVAAGFQELAEEYFSGSDGTNRGEAEASSSTAASDGTSSGEAEASASTGYRWPDKPERGPGYTLGVKK